MKLADVRAKAFAMPLNNPDYPKGPYKFYNREYIVITYRTDPERLRELVPEPLEVVGDTVNYEFIRMPDSTGFGDYTETGQVIPVRFRGADGAVQEGGYVHAMYLDDDAPIAGGREIWGFPKKLASPKISHESDVIVATLHYGSVLCVSASIGYKYREVDPAPLLKSMAKPSFMIKIIPHVDCTPRICELVRYYTEDVTIKGAWDGPAALQLFDHVQCDVARLPVREVVSASHFVTDLTLGLGEVVFDYLKEGCCQQADLRAVRFGWGAEESLSYSSSGNGKRSKADSAHQVAKKASRVTGSRTTRTFSSRSLEGNLQSHLA
jgi:acetoacetate decarboxylase